jgi:hypothetical protein
MKKKDKKEYERTGRRTVTYWSEKVDDKRKRKVRRIGRR